MFSKVSLLSAVFTFAQVVGLANASGEELNLVDCRTMSDSISGELSQLTSSGENPYDTAAIIVVRNGAVCFSSRGNQNVELNSIFEIGSITKVFTSLILADAVSKGELELTDEIGTTFPEQVSISLQLRQLTFAQLSTQTSGLSRMPQNWAPADPLNQPYADYTRSMLFEYLKGASLVGQPGQKYGYSNVGVGLLGLALESKLRRTYGELLKERVFSPLGVSDSTLDLTNEQQSRALQGFRWDGEPAQYLKFASLDGTGAIKSSIRDMISFMLSQTHPTSSKLEKAILLSQKVHHDGPEQNMGLGWHIDRVNDQQVFWHDGATYGFHNYLMVDPAHGAAVLVIANETQFSGSEMRDSIYEVGRKVHADLVRSQ